MHVCRLQEESRIMARHGWILGIMIFLSGSFYTVTAEEHVCKTFGSGVIQMFNGTMFHVNSTCPMVMTHFSHGGVDSFISVQRNTTGVITKVKILVNKVETIIQNGVVTVEGKRISLPYDHFYQSVYNYGIYTRLQSKLFPLYLTWYNVSESVTSLWVQLNGPLVDGMMGICGNANSSETKAQLFTNIISDGACVITDSNANEDAECGRFRSPARPCLGLKKNKFTELCKQSINTNVHKDVKCSFYEEFILPCNESSPTRAELRKTVSCSEPQCPGDLRYMDEGLAFPPSCSSPKEQTDYRARTCVPPNGLVLNDRAEGYRAVRVEDCPCVYGGKTYSPGHTRTSKCQECVCSKGKWSCSANLCPTRCVIEGWFVTTFDGIQYSLLQKCTYLAAGEQNWSVAIKFSETDRTIEKLVFRVEKEEYTFSVNSAQLGEDKITDLSQTEHATVFWQSSMFIQVKTSFGLKMQVRVYPEIQMYLYLPPTTKTKGLCGTYNNKTEDDFTTSSGIIENSPQPFALSWVLSPCVPNEPPICNSDTEMYAEKKCGQLRNVSGVFARCHDYVPVNIYFDTCVQRTCQSTGKLEESVCLGLANYAKACGGQGINVEDWRAETGCTQTCESNLRFSYAMKACNRTCRSLTGPDPTCDVLDDPVEGCGCMVGTHLNMPLQCSPQDLCQCTYPGGMTRPGPVMIKGQHCMCENGILECSSACDCAQGKICVNCGHTPVITTQRTCESLSKPFSMDESCVSGCYCPDGLFEDHNGICVTRKSCTCKYGDVVYASGDRVESNCKTCTCEGGHWHCTGEPCPGACEVYGNGQYKTFDSKWYRFDGHCQYTLVQDVGGQFSIKSESVPCCDEALTCSRSITVELQNEVILVLRDMNVTEKFLSGWSLSTQQLYTVHTVGLYFIIDVPAMNLTVIWDKQTRVKIELKASWKGKLKGLCGDFDGRLVNDMTTRSSSVVFNTIEFGNSWKAAVPPCSDVTHEVFPCERHSYCSAWAQRRCMILHSDTFKDCQQKVDPEPYYQACVLESCSCEFEGKFLGFCTAVAAYAEACSAQNICIKWRTPDLCPVYCDYYNEEGQCSWHYEPCAPRINTCGKNSSFTGKLEGCYPRCPAEMPYFDENKRACTTLDNCTCYLNNTMLGPGDTFNTPDACCTCVQGQIICDHCTTTTTPVPTTTTPETTTTTPVTTITTPETTTPVTTTTTPETTTTTPETTTTTPVTTITTPETTTPVTTTTTPETTITTTTPVTTTSTPETTITTTTPVPTTTTPETTITTPVTTITTPETTTPVTTTTTPETTTTTTTPVTTTTTPETTITTTTPVTTTSTPETTITTTTPVPTTTTPETTITTTTPETTTPGTTTTTPVTTTPGTTNTTPVTTTTTPETTTPGTTTTTPVTTTTTPGTTSTTPGTTTTTPETTTPETTTPVTTTTTPVTTTTTPETTTPVTTTTTPVTTTTTPETSTTTPETTTTTPVTTITTPETTTPVTTTTTPETTITTTTPVTTTSTPETTITTTTPVPTTTTPETTITTPVTTITTPETTTPVTTTTTPETTTTTTTPVTTTTTPETTITTTTPVTTTSTPETTITTTTPVPTTTTPETTITTTTPETTTPGTTTTTPVTTTPGTTNTTPVTTTTTPETTTPGTTTTTPVTTTTTPGTTSTTPGTTTTTPETTTPETTTPVTTTTTPVTTTTTPETTTPVTTTTTPVTTTTTPETSTTTPETTITTPTPVPTTPTPETTTTTPVTTITTPETTTPVTTTTTPETTITTPVTTTTTPETTITTPTPVPTTSTPETTTTTPGTTTTTPVTTTTTPVTTITTPEIPTPVTTTTTPETSITTTTPVTTTTTPETTITTTTPVTTTTTPETTTTTPETTTTTPVTTTTTPVTTTTTPETTITTTTPETTVTTTTPVTTTTTPETTTTTPVTTTTTPETTTPGTTTTTPVTTTTTPVTTTTTPETTTPGTTTTTPVTTTTTPVTTTTTPETTITTTTPETTVTTTTPVTTTTTPETTITTTTPETTVTTTTPVTTTTTPETTTTTPVTTTPTPETTTPGTTTITAVTTTTTPLTTTTTPETTTPGTTTTTPETTMTTPETTTPGTTTTTPGTTTTTPVTTTTTPSTPETTTTPSTPSTPETTFPIRTGPTSSVITFPQVSTNCTDVKGNWPNGAQWTEGCINKTCNNGEIMKSPVSCQEPDKPTCPKGQPQLVKEDQGCCDIWQCERNCTDLRRNQNWPSGAQWTEDCFSKTCNDSVIMASPVTCPESVKPTCLKGQPQLVKDEQGCCETWRCDCQCEVYGDPHYNSFSSTTFDFLENCTYTLVEEKTPRHHLRISIDTYYCEPLGSCVRGVIVKYHNNTVLLEVEPEDEVKALLNQQIIQPPYNQDGIRFEGSERDISVYIDKIRSYVSLSMFNTLRIKLASEHFSQNTHGQCGVCGGPSCTRRDGTIESESCCNMTAYEWIEDDPQKPYCQRTRQNVSCTPDIPPPPPPTICKAPLCDILRHEIFKSCSQDTDVETMVKNCKFDYCLSQKNITVCSPLESLADHCKKSGVCVAWRNLTDGICDITCPEGMQFDECRDTPVKVCHGGVAENVTDSMRSGCFCPDDQVLAGKHKQICVSECTNCKGPLGEPMPIGATWESNCHTCTCNNQTRTEECQPKPTPPTPTCRPGFTITTDCCDNPTCVEKTCEYNGTIYKVGESWKDHTDPCVTFSCTSEGTEMQKSVCPEQNCSEEFRVWDKNHCCYTCEVSCQVRLTRMKVALDNCTKEVDLPRCGGYCDSKSLWVRSGEVLQLEQDQLCCQMGNYEMKEISLECSGAPPTKYSYKHITNCDCKV